MWEHTTSVPHHALHPACLVRSGVYIVTFQVLPTPLQWEFIVSIFGGEITLCACVCV